MPGIYAVRSWQGPCPWQSLPQALFTECLLKKSMQGQCIQCMQGQCIQCIQCIH